MKIYIVSLLLFLVIVLCSGGVDRVSRARRLYALFDDEAIDEWIDSLNDHAIDHFYKLMMNNQVDQIMNAFNADQSYYDFVDYIQDEYDDFDDYDYDYGYDGYDENDYDMMEMGGNPRILAVCQKKKASGKPMTGHIKTTCDLQFKLAEQGDPVPVDPETLTGFDKIGYEILKLTNAYRKKKKLEPLEWDQVLCDVGKDHSKKLVDGTYPDINAGSNGASYAHINFKTRFAYYKKNLREGGWGYRPTGFSENVARPRGDFGKELTADKVAKSVFEKFQKSPLHEANLVKPDYNKCGVAVYQDSTSKEWGITQMIARTQ